MAATNYPIWRYEHLHWRPKILVDIPEWNLDSSRVARLAAFLFLSELSVSGSGGGSLNTTCSGPRLAIWPPEMWRAKVSYQILDYKLFSLMKGFHFHANCRGNTFQEELNWSQLLWIYKENNCQFLKYAKIAKISIFWRFFGRREVSYWTI